MFSYTYIFSICEFIFTAIYVYRLNKKIQKLKKEYNDLDDLYYSSLDDMNAAEDQVRKLGLENAHKDDIILLKENENKVLQRKLRKQIKYNTSLEKKLGFSRKEVEELYAGWTANWTKTNTEIGPDSVYDIYQDKYKHLFVNIPFAYHSYVTRYNDYIEDVPIEYHKEIIKSRTKYRQMKDINV